MYKTIISLFTVLSFTKVVGQEKNFPKNPQEVIFKTSDIQNFWKAFDTIENSDVNPFETYIKNGTIGLQDFIPYRIISADSLLTMVDRRRLDYEKIRGIKVKIKEEEKKLNHTFMH